MAQKNNSLCRFSLSLLMAGGFAALVQLSAAGALAQTPAPAGPADGAEPQEIRIVATEFRFAPAKVRVTAGQRVTVILDNSDGETEHGISFPALGLRLQAKAGEIARKTAEFDKPGQYDFVCDLPGHREAGMEGTLVVGDSLAKR
jgi:plastocyanin